MLEHLDFVPLDGRRVLVVLVAGGHVSHKVIEPIEDYELTQLQEAANYLNSEFRGRTLLEIRQLVLAGLSEDRILYDALMARALRLANSTLEGMDDEAPTVFIQGTSLLVEVFEGGEPDVTLENLRTLLRMIEEKTRLVALLDEVRSAATASRW